MRKKFIGSRDQCSSIHDSITNKFAEQGYITYAYVKELFECPVNVEDYSKGWDSLGNIFFLEESIEFPDFSYDDTKDRKDDPVNHPSHYQSQNGLEVIDVIEAFTNDLVGMEAVCTANAIKYILRWKKKGGVQDLEKARWYLNRLIDRATVKEGEPTDEH